MPDNVIEVRGLSKLYRRGILRKAKQVLDDVSFDVPRGSVYGFLGHNGAGKSTTIKVLLDFVRYEKGQVKVLGADPSASASRSRIGFLPETADYYPFLSPRKLLLIYCDIFKIARPEAKRRTDMLLDLVGLTQERDEKIATFSKGMKQRVGIAQALLNEPELLILDEPGSGLDPLGQREIRNLILDQKKAGRTIFFSSHELSEVEAVCDEAAIIRRGRIVKTGALTELVPYREELAVRLKGRVSDLLTGKAYVGEIRPQASPEETVFIASPGSSLNDLAAQLQKDGFQIISIGTVRDSLEDIFLDLMKGAA